MSNVSLITMPPADGGILTLKCRLYNKQKKNEKKLPDTQEYLTKSMHN